ncbi:MAG: hypothetical protein AB7G15_20405, partial [Alphaproteobacteria bacterium]
MADPVAAPPAPPALQSLPSLAYAIIAGLIVYVVLVVVMIALLSSHSDSLSRDSIWKFFIFVLIYQLPQIVVPMLAVVFSALFVKRYHYKLVYYVFIGIIIVGSALFSKMFLLSGSWRGVYILLVQAFVAFAAWYG